VKSLLDSRKVHRFFERRFAALEPRLVERNLRAHESVPRPHVDWADKPIYADLLDFYSLHDETCSDVRGIPTETWWRSHFFGRYPQHAESHGDLAFDWCRMENGVRFRSRSVSDSWIYLVSRDLLPPVYAISFDYTPRNVFKEQLQLDFAATSLADRHRYILSNNEKLRYQRIERGFWLPDVAQKPWSVPVGRTTRIRLEVVDRTFALLADDGLVACWRDGRYRPHPSRNMLLFWNGEAATAMDFDLANFGVYLPKAVTRT